MCERLAVEALEPRYRREHIVAQPRPVEAAVGHVPAELAGVVNILREMGAIDEQLRGHAATDYAGAADALFLRHLDARAVRGSDTAGAHPARPGADDEQIIVEFGHGRAPRWNDCLAPMWVDGSGLPIEFCDQHKTSRRCERSEAISRSEEHTSELQSLMRISYAHFCLNKKKIIQHNNDTK